MEILELEKAPLEELRNIASTMDVPNARTIR